MNKKLELKEFFFLSVYVSVYMRVHMHVYVDWKRFVLSPGAGVIGSFEQLCVLGTKLWPPVVVLSVLNY